MKNTIITVALGIAGGIAAGAFLAKCVTISDMQKWRRRIESKQIDTDIRLDLLEYNHLHEDGHLRMVFESLEEN